GAAGAYRRIELLEHTARRRDVAGRADEAHLVAARVRVDAELLLEDAQRAIALPIEMGGRLVVFEDERLARGGGCVSGQKRSPRASTLRRQEHGAVVATRVIVGSPPG